MSKLLEIDLPARMLGQWEYVVLFVSATVLLSSVALKFLDKLECKASPLYRERNIVATISMTLFFFAIYYFGRVYHLEASWQITLAMKLAGCLLVVVGTIINVAARLAIGRFWSDHIEIQKDHSVVRQWPFSWSRHPMYGSLVLFGVGMGLLSLNPLVVVAVLVLFLSAMVYRAGREERSLLAACGEEYLDYKTNTPMILPRFPEYVARPARGCLGAMQLWGLLSHQIELFVLSGFLTLGLSFMMRRDDFRIAYKMKTVIIFTLVAAVSFSNKLFPLLIIPTFASFMSLSGHCPGTLALKLFDKKGSSRETLGVKTQAESSAQSEVNNG